MRPVIDSNNLLHSEETLVYISRSVITFRILALSIAFGYSFYLLFDKEYLIGLIVFAVSCFFAKEIKKIVSEWEVVQMRINSQGIQIKDEPIISWDKIENERTFSVLKNKNGGDAYYEYYFAFYDANQHTPMQFLQGKLNLSAEELLRCAKIHKARFNKQNNPS